MQQSESRTARPGTAGDARDPGEGSGNAGSDDVAAAGEEAEKGNLKRGGSLRTKMGLSFRKGRIDKEAPS